MVPINLYISVINTTQFILEQSEPQSNNLISSVMNPIILDDTGDQESN